ncbi:MAG: tRNA-dependent cyclodipeptide synthase [Desulfovermiculus sp.]
MIIKSLFNTTEQQINARHWNPYLGISINNKAFTVDYIYVYMDWATQRAKECAAILIVDILQHINNQVLGRSKPVAAIEKAFRKADEVHQMCEEAKSRLSSDKISRLVIIEWTDIMQDEYFQHNLSIIKEEYVNNKQFRNALLSITKRNLGAIVSRLDDEQVEMLTQYIVNELPELITGFNHGGIHYNLNVYPGKISSIYAELLELELFRQIHSKLRVIGEIASAEAYSQANQAG